MQIERSRERLPYKECPLNVYIDRGRALKIVYVTGRYIYQQYEHKTTNRLVGSVDLKIIDLGSVANDFNYYIGSSTAQ